MYLAHMDGNRVMEGSLRNFHLDLHKQKLHRNSAREA